MIPSHERIEMSDTDRDHLVTQSDMMVKQAFAEQDSIDVFIKLLSEYGASLIDRSEALHDYLLNQEIGRLHNLLASQNTVDETFELLTGHIIDSRDHKSHEKINYIHELIMSAAQSQASTLIHHGIEPRSYDSEMLKIEIENNHHNQSYREFKRNILLLFSNDFSADIAAIVDDFPYDD